tara:strand:+ start:53 stop:340 length:288 start_codon:yes stop_codon:yes gene_type:complete
MENPEIPFVVKLTPDWTFFGLTPKYRLTTQDQIFDLVYHSQGGFTYQDVYNMPVHLRVYHIKKIQKIFEKEKKSHEKAMRKAKSQNRKTVPKRRR